MLVQSSSPMARISKLQITTTSPLFSGEVGQGYLFAFNAINGILPYTWSTSGPIPAGMILNPSTGALMGTPSASYSNVFPVTVMDALGSTATANFGLTIVSALAITTLSPLTAAIQGVLYSNTFAESGGIPPFVWSFNGAPTGSNTWGLSGPTLSGTPANAETDIIPVRVTDSLGALAQGNFSLTVQAVQVATPTFNPAAGTYATSQLITISCSTVGSTIYYTKDGSTPSVIGGVPQGTTQQYSAQVLVSATETLKAIGTAAGMTTSAVGSATYTINAIPAASQFKFNPGDYVQGNGATAANLNSAVAPFVGGVNATFIGIAPWYYWDALEQTTLGTYDFSTIITDFNAWQAAVAANGNAGAVGHFIPMVGDYHNSALTPAGLPTYNPRFGGIPQYILNNPATYGSMPNNGFGGWIPTSWNGTTWGFQRAALWRVAVTARRNALAQALAATSFTTTAGPYSGQTFTFDNHPLIEMYADFSPTDLGTIQSSPDIPADYTFPAWNNSFLNRVGPNTGFTKTITALMPGFGGNDFLGHNDPTAQGALVAAMLASPTAQSCTDVFANGALTFAQSYLTGLTWNGSAFVPGGTDYRGHIDSSPSIQGFDYANQLGSNTANTAATVTVIANQCVNTLKSVRRLWAAVNSTGAYVPSYFTSVIQPGVKAALPCITLLPTCEMFAPAGLTGSASGTTVSLSWTTYAGVGTGLSYNIYDSGTLVGNSASGTLTLTGVSVGAHNYTVGMVNANGTGAQSAPFSVTVGTPRYLGINSNNLSYFTLEQPLLNIMKMAAVTAAFGNTGLCGNWLTSNVGTSETNEEPYLQLDSSGWPTSLVAGNGFGGVQQFTFAQTWIFGTLNPPNGYSALPPGASQWFPWNGITYQAQIQGAGTIKLVGASAITVLTGGANLTISGTQIISTLSIGQTATISFTIGPNGLQLQVTAVNSTSNNIKIPYIVDQSQLAAYNAGEILSKNFKAAMTGRSTAKVFSCLRNLGLQNTTQQEYKLVFTGNLALNAMGGTLASLTVQGNFFTTWPFYTGTRKVVFATGQVVNMSGTFGSASVTWDVPLNAAVTTAAVAAMAMLSKTSGWSERTLVGDMTWAGTSGAPLEAIIQISNELGIDSWLLTPAMLPTVDPSYLANLASLLFNGTGANITGWNVTSFTGLSASQRQFVEYSNECWNFGSGYQEANYVTMMSVPTGFFAIQGEFYGGQEYYGTQVAGIGDAFFAVYGAAMTSRVGVVMMNQAGVGNGSGFMAMAMNTPDWTSRAYTHHIYGYGCAPYFGPTYIDGNSNMSSADAGTIAALADPVGELYSLAYTNHGASGNTYASMPTNGYLGKTLATTASYIAAFAGQPWQGLPFVCYEGGLDVGNYSGNGAIGTSLTAMIRDIRAEYLNNDPTHLLSASGTGYLPGLKANGVSFINTLGSAGIEWGQFEVLTQIESMPPYTNAPRYLGDYNFAAGN